jgi:hypothetical protein
MGSNHLTRACSKAPAPMPQLRTVHHLKATVLVELVSSVVRLAILRGNVPPGLPLLEQEIK